MIKTDYLGLIANPHLPRKAKLLSINDFLIEKVIAFRWVYATEKRLDSSLQSEQSYSRRLSIQCALLPRFSVGIYPSKDLVVGESKCR